jgi:hypothetical protein
MMEGADEHGSLSFSQLVYPNRFGDNSACAAHRAIKLNLYDPQDQVKTFAVHAAAEQTDAHNCPGGMNRAFVANALGSDYELTAVAGGEDIHDLVGIRGKDNRGTEEDGYEKLAKAIFYYNSPHAWISGDSRHSWPYLLKYKVYDANSAKNSTRTNVCHSCKYTIKVRRNFFGEGHLRTYIWRPTGLAAGAELGLDLNGDGRIADTAGNPESTTPWCFAYGESEWLNPGFQVPVRSGGTRPANWNDYRNRANRDSTFKISCN